MAAQAFSAREGDVLVGVDLHLRLLSRTVRGWVSVHADAAGKPEAAPWASAAVELVLEEKGAPPWEARWVSVDLPSPLPLEKAWWVVLTFSEGEVLWSLGTLPEPRALALLTPLGGLFRVEDDPWQERVPPSLKDVPAPSWALCRPRFSAPASPPVPAVFLRCGKDELTLEPDAEGRISLDAHALLTLKPTVAQPLEVVVRSPAAGELLLSALRVTKARRDTYPPFTSPQSPTSP
jgi:hypothetical protein